jgi:hypothetical protein
MSLMFRIPAELVRPLRIGLHGELGGAAQEIERVSDRYGRHWYPEWYEEPLAYFDAVRALLDEIGWGEPPKSIEIDVDLTKIRARGAQRTAQSGMRPSGHGRGGGVGRSRAGEARQAAEGSRHDRARRGTFSSVRSALVGARRR